ncbi:hypothetical protein ES703_35481 [subsurface metagenome]
MVFIKILLNSISPQLKKKIIDFIKSLKPSPPVYTNEWDEFAIKILFSIFDIKD